MEPPPVMRPASCAHADVITEDSNNAVTTWNRFAGIFRYFISNLLFSHVDVDLLASQKIGRDKVSLTVESQRYVSPACLVLLSSSPAGYWSKCSMKFLRSHRKKNMAGQLGNRARHSRRTLLALNVAEDCQELEICEPDALCAAAAVMRPCKRMASLRK